MKNLKLNNMSKKRDKVGIVFCGPSGAGKSTLVHAVMQKFPELSFSVSATTRTKRENEVHGKDYYFLTKEEFMFKVDNEEFVEHEEVYPGIFYGTTEEELVRINAEGKVAIFDVDVKGAFNLKKVFKEKLLLVFVAPPSIEGLRERISKRNTETQEALDTRMAKVEEEMAFMYKADKIIFNEKLTDSMVKAERIVEGFLNPFVPVPTPLPDNLELTVTKKEEKKEESYYERLMKLPNLKPQYQRQRKIT